VDLNRGAKSVVCDIDTPALLLDYRKLTANIEKMAAFAADARIRLRPHAKTHKCVEIALLQLAAGAAGITCATLSEAEALTDGGVSDILIANEIVGATKIDRLVELAGRCSVTVAVDDADNVRALSEAAVSAKVTLRCYVEVNIMDRCGVEPGKPVADLARSVAASGGLELAGIQAYEGHLQNLMPYDERVVRVEHDMRRALQAKQSIEAIGLSAGVVSGGGTGTFAITGRLGWMTELQPGSYATMDATYHSVGADFEHALFVLATVISRPRANMAVVDVGLKGLTPEHGDPVVLVEGARWLGFSEEHGQLELSGPSQGLAVGDKVALIPGHGCTTINLYDRYHVLDGDVLKDTWRVVHGGRNR
jgi:3-hydroxy-D-aspartate aldolase